MESHDHDPVKRRNTDMNDEEDKRLEAALDDLRKGEADLDRAEELEDRAKEEIRRAEKEIEEARHQEFVLFVGAERFVTPHEHLTGTQIKAMVPGWLAEDGLELEGEGHEPNRLISDHETVHFYKDRASHFIKVPPATFGKQP
jgi:hypothetical protein